MKASILIVSKNRSFELTKTLYILEKYIDKSVHEVRVFLDGFTEHWEGLLIEFPWVHWEKSDQSLGASRARNILYKNAKGKILVGFDDDAHPLQENFIEITESLFQERANLGIIAFREIKGIYTNDGAIPQNPLIEEEDFLTRDFMGCGFAIKKEVYDKTRGFPVWIDIYGEEACLALETLNLGQNILFTYKISVNHRKDREKRAKTGGNYFRFEKQLKNTSFFYVVYYPFPLLLKKILKLYVHNFRKYALKDKYFLKAYFSAIFQVFWNLNYIIKFRKTIREETLKKINQLPNPKY